MEYAKEIIINVTKFYDNFYFDSGSTDFITKKNDEFAKDK
jgi:hypothetical protein